MTQSQAHPCFSYTDRHSHGRIHVPVAPRCNIQCNYCNRKYDCVNESRPGVTSAVLTPTQALGYIRKSLQHDPRISVAGIAGPGDAFANPDETLATLRGIRDEFPNLIACLSTNGLNLGPYIDEIHDLGVRYITMTINGVDPVILAEVYAWVRKKGRTFRGLAGAQLLLENQMENLEKLKLKGFTVKVNTVVMPGINDEHIPELARHLGQFKVDRMNLIPVQQNENTFFDDVTPPETARLDALRLEVGQYVQVMTHCQRCRSDAAGILGQDDPTFQELLIEASTEPALGPDGQPRGLVAIATQEGMLVNQHLGEATQLAIFERQQDAFHLKELRDTPPKGLGDSRWLELAGMLADCSHLLVGGVGPNPLNILKQAGLHVIETDGFVEDALESIYKGEDLRNVKSRDSFSCGSTCKGSGQGCG